MRLGMLTSALPGLSLEEVARWAETAGFEVLEVAAWPAGATVGGAADHLDPVGFGPADPGWWCYRAVGLGELDWRRVVDVLYEGGFDGVVFVEHEDPVWVGTPQRGQAGLGLARQALRPLIVPEA